MAINKVLYYTKGHINRQNTVFYTHIPIVIHSFNEICGLFGADRENRTPI